MKKLLGKFINPLTIIAVAVILRLLPHVPNVSPITAMALFGGVYLNKRYALIVPLLAMVASDILLGFSLITPFVYGSFLLIGFIGLFIRRYKSMHMALVTSLISSLLFFLITNFGVWLVWNFYPKTPAGLWECFVAALPFFRNTLLGDLFYVSVFFGGYEVVKKFVLQKNAESI